MSSAAIQDAIIAELRARPLMVGDCASRIREAVGCSAPAFAAAVQSLRYQGKVKWNCLELSPSLAANGGGEDPPQQSAGVREPAVDGPEGAPSSGPDDEEDGGVNDVARERPLPAPARVRGGGGKGFVSKRLLHQAGIRASQTAAARRAPPAPTHEPEIARLVREESTASLARRAQAQSTGTVNQPLELRKFGVPELSVVEAVTSLLAESPHDLVVAVTRKHPALWRRILLLGRATDQRPAAALYAVIEAGLEALEPQREEAA